MRPILSWPYDLPQLMAAEMCLWEEEEGRSTYVRYGCLFSEYSYHVANKKLG